jgi:hypothetical protein
MFLAIASCRMQCVANCQADIGTLNIERDAA